MPLDNIVTTPTPAGLTPQFAKEPPKEILGQKFTLDDVPSPNTIVTGKQIGRASCRERVSSPV